MSTEATERRSSIANILHTLLSSSMASKRSSLVKSKSEESEYCSGCAKLKEENVVLRKEVDELKKEVVDLKDTVHDLKEEIEEMKEERDADKSSLSSIHKEKTQIAKEKEENESIVLCRQVFTVFGKNFFKPVKGARISSFQYAYIWYKENKDDADEDTQEQVKVLEIIIIQHFSKALGLTNVSKILMELSRMEKELSDVRNNISHPKLLPADLPKATKTMIDENFIQNQKDEACWIQIIDYVKQSI